MKKHTKKKIIYFVTAFFLTLLIGAIALAGYSVIKERTGEKQEVVEAGAVVATGESVGSVAGVQMAEQPEKEAEQVPEKELANEDIGQEERIEEGTSKETEDVTIEEIEERPGEVVLAFGGDICFHDPFANMGSLAQRGGSIESCIGEDLLEQMRTADICMVNNEFPYSNRGTPIPEKTFTFRSKPENVKLLHEMGVDVVSLANNHAFDHGETALLDTFDILEGAGVIYTGAGRNLAEASEPAVFEVNGVRIAILAATQIERLDTPDTKGATESSAGVLRCFSEKELEHVLGVIEQTKKECDVLVVFIHWGTENTDVLDWAQPYQADLISKAGADLIVGAHPHCLQGLDCVNGVPVIYSLGNYWFNSKPLDTALLKVTASVTGVKRVQVVPARQENCTTSMLYDGEKQRVLNYLQSLSPNVSLDGEGYVSW